MRAALTLLTSALLASSSIMAAEKKTVTIQTPSGEITFKEVPVPNQKDFNDKVTELTPEERTALDRDTVRVPEFIAAFVPLKERTGDVLEDLDKAFAAWLKSGKRETFAAQDVIRIAGCGLGAHAIKHLGMRWANVTDAPGTDIALVSEKPQARSYPFSSVQYRIEDGETDFIVALFRAIEHIMKDTTK